MIWCFSCTVLRRYYDVIGSAPTDDLVDRLCSPAPPECKLGTLTRREPQVDDRMSNLLKEMEVRPLIMHKCYSSSLR